MRIEIMNLKTVMSYLQIIEEEEFDLSRHFKFFTTDDLFEAIETENDNIFYAIMMDDSFKPYCVIKKESINTLYCESLNGFEHLENELIQYLAKI